MFTHVAPVLLALLLPATALAQADGKLQIHYMNAGQGDGAVLISPQGTVVLFDLGVKNQCGGPLGYLQSLRLTKVDHVIVSHYHSDHIGCAKAFLSAFPLTGWAIDRGGTHASTAFASYVAAVGARRRTAVNGERITLDEASGTPVFIDIVAANGNGITTTDENALGVVAVVRFGDFDAVFGGDLPGTLTDGAEPDPDPDPQFLSVGVSFGGEVTSTPAGVFCTFGTLGCGALFPAGTVVTLNAVPNTFWTFCGWSGDCTGYSCTVSMSGPKSVYASFGSRLFSCSAAVGVADSHLASGMTDSPGGVAEGTSPDMEATIASLVGQVEVYQVHRHGSRDSSQATWMNATRPMVGIVSVGASNTNGYPNADALSRIHGVGTRTYWTSPGRGAAPLPDWDVVSGDTIVEVGPGETRFTVRSTISGTQHYPIWSGGSAPIDPALDSDGDGLPDGWEKQYGLNETSGTGDDGPRGDPDRDGVTNAQEQAAGTHPRGVVRRYLAEGATSDFFQTRLAFVNPGAEPAHTWLQFQKGDGTTQTHALIVAANSRTTLDVAALPGMTKAEFSTAIEADQDLVVDRTVTWDKSGYGSHTETAVESAATTWYLAEGATHSGFDLFYLIHNPNDTAVEVTVKYLFPAGAPIVRTYPIAAKRRFNVWVDGEGPALENTDVSAVITSTAPIIVERAMYLTAGGQIFRAGHESAGVTAPAPSWFLAEGNTGPFFDLFVLIANPGESDAQVRATYLLPDGSTLQKQYTVRARSRFNIWVDLEDPKLADTAVSTTIESLNSVPIIVERAMWWPGDFTTWDEAHNSPGGTMTGTTWAMAEGEVGVTATPGGGELQTETFILIANPSTSAASAKVTLLFEDGTNAIRTFSVNATSRFNVWVRAEFPEAIGTRFGAIVESPGDAPAQLVVERAMYSDAFEREPPAYQSVRVPWANGTNALATRLK